MGARPHPAVRVVAGLAVALVVVPAAGLVARLPWGSVGAVVTSDALTVPLRVSILTTLAATVVAVVLGAAMGMVTARAAPRSAALLRAVLTVPVVVPPVVAGLMLLVAFGREAPAGRVLDAIGVSLPFSAVGVIAAQVFVSFPFVAVAVERSVVAAGGEPDDVAAVAGVPAAARLLRVTLPSVRGALLSGGVLAWARAFGEFGATLTVAGSFPGRTETLPQAVYLAVAGDRDVAVVGGCLMMVIAVSVALAGRALSGGDGWFRTAPRGRGRRTT